MLGPSSDVVPEAVADPRGGASRAKLSAVTEHAPIGPGTRLGPYELTEEIGTGASATVFLARDRAGKSFAVKVRRRGQAEMDRRFLREFESMRLLRVPGVVQVHEAGIEEAVLWFSMDYVLGTPFPGVLASERSIGARVRVAIELGRKLCGVLASLHEAGFVHRDIKPTNVLVDDKNEVHVLDFGIGRYFGDQDTLSSTGEVLGTVPYMAPEQLAGLPSDNRVDLFAVGLMLHEAIAGPRERPLTTVGWIPKICLERLPALASVYREVPRGLSHLVDALLAVDPHARPTAREATLALQRVASGVESPEWPTPPFVDPGPWWHVLEGCIGQDAQPAVWVLEGQVGCGRGRLAEQLHRMALLQGTWTVHVRCRIARVGGPVSDLLEKLVAELDEDTLVEVVGDAAPVLREIWPHLPVPLPKNASDSPTTAKIGRAIVGVVERVARDRPLLLVVHDLESVDPFTAKLIPMLAGVAGENLGLLLLHETRWATVTSREVVATVKRDHRAGILTVPRFSTEVANALAAKICPSEPPSFDRPMAPAAVIEVAWKVLSTWRGEQFVAPEPSLWPLALQDGPVPVPVWREVAGGSEPSPWVRLDPSGAVLAGATARALARARVANLKRSAATLAAAWGASRIEGSGHAADLATLWLLAGDPVRAWDPAAEAAIAAERLELYPEARQWLLTLDVLPGPEQRRADQEFDLAIARARVALNLDSVAVRLALVDAAEAHLTTADQEHRIRLLRAEYGLRLGEARTALVSALRVGSSATGSLQVQALLLAVRCRTQLRQYAEAPRDLDRAEALLNDRSADRSAEDALADAILAVRIGNARAELALVQQDLLWCRALCQQNIRSASQHGYVRGIAESAHRLAAVLRMLGRRREAEHQIRSAREAVAQTGDAVLDAETGLALATLLVERGETLPARHLLDETIRQIRSLSLEHLLPIAMRVALQIATLTGDPTEGNAALAGIHEVGGGHPETPAAIVHWWRSRGDLDRALAVKEPDDRGFGAVLWRVEHARAALMAGYVEQGRKAAESAVDRASELGFTELQTYALLVLGALRVDASGSGPLAEVDDEGWTELQRRATQSMFTEVFLGALEMDARRLEHTDPALARNRWRTLQARARELGYQPGVEESQSWLLEDPASPAVP
jgi:tRNA A-37 threonylcarbamoyl transferase component Bud32